MAIKLPDLLIADCENRLKQNAIAQKIIADKDKSQARILACEIAKAYVGVREKGGNNKGKEVSWFQDTVGVPMSQAWCMDFVQSVYALVDHFLGTKCLLFVSEGCDQVWTKTKTEQRVKRVPAPGATIIWGHYTAGGKYKGGHTGIVIYVDGDMIYVVEGNTESGFGKHDQVVRDGGGVYFTKRSMKGNGDMKVRGYLKPY